jgi:hypothetical protein
MTETVPTSPATMASPGLIARMIGVVFSPRETFEAVAARPRWLGVMAATLAVGAACQYVILSSPELQDNIINQQIRAMEAQGPVSDAQVAGVERFIMALPYVYAGGAFIIGPLFVAIIAGILMWIFTMLMGGNGTFKQVYALVTHSGVVSMLSGIFSAALVLAGIPPSGVRPPGANLGVFVPMLEETSFLTVMLTSIDLILVWWLITLAIGLAVLYKRRPGGIATSLIAIYVVIAVVIATFTSGS